MLDDFMIRAALAGVGVAVVAGVLGCFLVWRRMAYFGDATAHAALLGVAISLALNLSIFTGVLVICLIVALMVTRVSKVKRAATALRVKSVLRVLRVQKAFKVRLAMASPSSVRSGLITRTPIPVLLPATLQAMP